MQSSRNLEFPDIILTEDVFQTKPINFLSPDIMYQPNLKHGLEYWERQEASIDGVLGGYGNGSLPRIDALSSRLFLLSILPHLCKIPSALSPLEKSDEIYQYRALDVGTVVSASVIRITHISFKVQA